MLTNHPTSLKIAGLLLILLLSASLGACNLPGGNSSPEPKNPETRPTQDLSLLATLTQQVEQEQEASPTALPTMTPLPTATQPTVPEPAEIEPSEIKFRSGGTLAYLKGGIGAEQQLPWTLEAASGQTLIAGVSSNDVDVYFEIKGLDDGVTLVPFSDRASSAVVRLPSTQEYQITLTSPTINQYFLTVQVPVDLAVTTNSGPVKVDGYVDVLGAVYPDALTYVRYLLYLEQSTVLNAKLSSVHLNSLTLALTGVEDGVPYLRYQTKSEGINDFPVPVSQLYYLDVYDVSSVSAKYTLEIEVTE